MRSKRAYLLIKMLSAVLAAGLVLASLAGCSAGAGAEGAGQEQPAGGSGSSGSSNASGSKERRGSKSSDKGKVSAGSEEQEAPEEPGIPPVEEDGFVFETLGAHPGNLSCGGYTVTAEDGTVYAANISGSGTITRITPDGRETVICDVEPWAEMKKVTHLNLWDGILYFEIGPVFNYTLYFATYHYPINGIYRLDLAWTDEYLKHYAAREEGYEELPEPVSVLQNVGAMGASYAEIAYYDPLVRDGKLYYWVNNDFKRGRQLYRADLGGENAVQIYDSAEHKVVSWTADDERVYISDDSSVFSIDAMGTKKILSANSGRSLQRYGSGLYFSEDNRICRIMLDPYRKDTVLEREGNINGFNVCGGKIYFIEELGTESVSSYIGIASEFGPEGFDPDAVTYAFRYVADPENAKYGNVWLKGPCVTDAGIFYIQSFRDPDGKEYGDVSYAEIYLDKAGIRESKTGPK